MYETTGFCYVNLSTGTDSAGAGSSEATPVGTITYDLQQASLVQALVSLVSGLKLRSENTSVLSVYNDAAQIPNYALTAIAGATDKGLVVNYPTVSQLTPNQNSTRAEEVAAFVYQALVNAGRIEAIPSPYIVKNP